MMTTLRRKYVSLCVWGEGGVQAFSPFVTRHKNTGLTPNTPMYREHLKPNVGSNSQVSRGVGSGAKGAKSTLRLDKDKRFYVIAIQSAF
jgi:hypothetical protein